MDWKRVSLVAAVLVSSTLTWAVAHSWLENSGRFSDILVMIFPGVIFILAGAVTAVAFMLMEHWADRLAAILTSWAVFVFFWTPNIWYLSALPILFGFWWMASQQMRHDLTDRRTIRISSTLGQGMKLILLGWFLMVSMGFYLLPTNRPTLTTVSKGIQSSVANNPIVQQQLPAGSQMEFGRYVDSVVRTWLGPVKQFIPPILAFGLFLTLWSLSILFRAPAIWLGDMLFRLLKRLGFVSIVETDVKAEVLKI